MRAPRPTLVLFGLLVFAMAVVAVVGVADHRHKQTTMNRLELSRWYCVHMGTHCGEGDPHRVERRWNERELGYQASLVVMGCAAAGLLLVSVRRRGGA